MNNANVNQKVKTKRVEWCFFFCFEHSPSFCFYSHYIFILHVLPSQSNLIYIRIYISCPHIWYNFATYFHVDLIFGGMCISAKIKQIPFARCVLSAAALTHSLSLSLYLAAFISFSYTLFQFHHMIKYEIFGLTECGFCAHQHFFCEDRAK